MKFSRTTRSLWRRHQGSVLFNELVGFRGAKGQFLLSVPQPRLLQEVKIHVSAKRQDIRRTYERNQLANPFRGLLLDALSVDNTTVQNVSVWNRYAIGVAAVAICAM